MLGSIAGGGAEAQILFHVEVGKQQPFLRNVANPPALRSQESPRLGVLKNVSIEANPPLCGSPESGNQFQQRGFAGARMAQQGNRASLHLQLELQHKRLQRELGVDGDHVNNRLARWRETPSVIQIATKASAVDIATNRSAAGSLPS